MPLNSFSLHFISSGCPGPAAAPGHDPAGPALPRPLQPPGVPQGGARVPVPPGSRPPAARPPPASPHQVTSFHKSSHIVVHT